MVLPPVERAVVLAPHPDDEVFGAGGLLQVLHADGVSIEVCAITDGEACWGELEGPVIDQLRRARTEESETALHRLQIGAVDRRRLLLPDGDVCRNGDVITAWLGEHLDSRTLCVAPWSGDGHPDHDAVGQRARDAAKSVGGPCLGYLVWAWHWADPDGADLPWSSCRRLELTRRQAARKRWAASAFVSQTRAPVPQGDGSPVVPVAVLRRFSRSSEVFVA